MTFAPSAPALPSTEPVAPRPTNPSPQRSSGHPRLAERTFRPNNRRTARGIVLHGALIIVGTAYLLPIAYMVLRSLTAWELGPRSLGEQRFTFGNYRDLNAELDIARLIFNTTIVTIARVAIQVVLSVTAGFAIARVRYSGSNFAFVSLVGCLMVPFPLMLIPLVLMIRVGGFYNSFVGLIAPTVVSGFGVLLFVQVFRRLPAELVDAARVDGCTPGRVLRHVAIPYARSAIGAFAVLVAIYSWNEYLWATVATTGPERQVLTVGVGRLADRRGWTDPGVQMAAACLATVPIVLLAIAMRRFTRGFQLRNDSTQPAPTPSTATPSAATQPAISPAIESRSPYDR